MGEIRREKGREGYGKRQIIGNLLLSDRYVIHVTNLMVREDRIKFITQPITYYYYYYYWPTFQTKTMHTNIE